MSGSENQPMQTNRKLALALLAGVSIGVVASRAVRAQQPKTRPAYVIAEIEVTEPAGLKEYAEKAPQIMADYHGRYVVRGGNIQGLEGDTPKGAIVVIGFDSMEKARAWYDSPAYKAIRPIRQRATKSRIYIAEGEAPE
jgi:uncharacterized protein (DUF1330 family)